MKLQGYKWEDKTWVVDDLPKRTNNPRQKMKGIYAIEVPPVMGVYIGQSVNIQSRWSQHRHVLRRGSCEIKEMQDAWNKYPNDFIFKVIELTDVDLLNKERAIAQKYVDSGYNLFNSYFHVNVKSLMISDEHIPIVTKLLRLATKGRLDLKELDRYLDTL
jgi:hypothetical protein